MFETRLSPLDFLLGKEFNRHCYVTQFAGNAHWADPHPCSLIGRAQVNSSERTSTLCLHSRTPELVPCAGNCTSSSRLYRLGVRRLKELRSREMSARGYALYSVCTKLPFSSSSLIPPFISSARASIYTRYRSREIYDLYVMSHH